MLFRAFFEDGCHNDRNIASSDPASPVVTPED
jgi:hypothetical protein